MPGDIVLLESGNHVPADLRLLQVNNLAIDESFLTGESVAVQKRTEPLDGEVPLAVSAIPEGLPVAITVVLSIATARMAKRGVIVRRLTAVEGLGSCTYIASDKTGTLTVNQQTAKVIALPNGQRFNVSGEGYNGDGKVTDDAGKPPTPEERLQLEHVVRAAIFCNEAQLTQQHGAWTHHGDAVDVALLALGFKVGLAPAQVCQSVTTVGEVPFESERGFAAAFYRDELDVNEPKVHVAVKGALERLLPRCTTMRTTHGVVPLAAAEIEQETLALAAEGYRVLLIATGEVEETGLTNPVGEEQLPSLSVQGLVGFIDPLRPEVKDAVARCRKAGIEVAMITGDHPATALAIARELGIADGDATVVTGNQLAAIGSSEVPEFLEIVKTAQLFARVAPLQKLHFVHAWEAFAEKAMLARGDISTEDIVAYVQNQQWLHKKALNKLGEALRDRIGTDAYNRVSPIFHLPKGPAKKMIALVAAELRADLVVMGTVARTGISGLIIGNTAETILDQLTCSVLAIKPPGFKTPVKLDE